MVLGFGSNAPVYHIYPVTRTTSEERAECSRGWRGGGWGGPEKGFEVSHMCTGKVLLYAKKGFLTGLGRLYVQGACYTRGARFSYNTLTPSNATASPHWLYDLQDRTYSFHAHPRTD